MDLKQALEAFTPGCVQEEADRAVLLEALRSEKNVFHRENRICHFTASSWITDTDRQQILMVWHNIYKSWSWTGGHADGDADLLGVAMREAREETGLEILRPVHKEIFSLETLSVPAHFRRGMYVPTHLHLNVTYLLEAEATQILRGNPDENSAVRWFPIRQAAEMTNEVEMLPIYRKLNQRMKRF